MSDRNVRLSQPNPEDDSYLLEEAMEGAVLYETIRAISDLINAMKGIPSLEEEVRQLGVFATQIILGDDDEENKEKTDSSDT